LQYLLQLLKKLFAFLPHYIGYDKQKNSVDKKRGKADEMEGI